MQSVSCTKNVYNLAKNEAFRSDLQDYKPFKKVFTAFFDDTIQICYQVLYVYFLKA